MIKRFVVESHKFYSHLAEKATRFFHLHFQYWIEETIRKFNKVLYLKK